MGAKNVGQHLAFILFQTCVLVVQTSRCSQHVTGAKANTSQGNL
jgi:hypothetical protein